MRTVPRPRRPLPSTAAAVIALLLVGAGTGARALAQDSWDAVYLGGAKIGHMHTYVEKVSDPKTGKDYRRVRLDVEMRLKRREDESFVKLMYGTIETLDGQVLRLDTRTDSGGNQDIRVHGDVDVMKQRMRLMINAGGRTQEETIPWTPDVRGPYGAEQSMASQPLKEHERRELKIYIPELNKVCDVTLEARAVEPIILGDGSKRPLLRVDQITRVGGKHRPEYDSRVFVDAEGQILKSEQDVMGGMVYYRTNKEAALAEGGPIQFDTVLESVVKVAHKITDPERTRHVVYRIKLEKSEPAQVFPADSRQSIRADKENPNSAVLEVQTAGPVDGQPAAGDVEPQYLKANAIINSDDVRVRTLAQRVTRGMLDPWKKASAINAWVHQNIRDKNFKKAFASAADVARSLSGDCTEHSVLAAAMCRAVGVPSRVVVGLVYVDDLGGFGYHMWVEVFANNRWIAIDPSYNQTTVDAVHIKLSESSLDGVTPFEAFLPLVTVVNRLQIEPVEIR
ncbi:MAG: transglutaminase-like domain-containing protein [Isosphaeraceae bacterium]